MQKSFSFSRNDYNSMFKYAANIGGRETQVSINMTGGRRVEDEEHESIRKPPFVLILTSW
jgi:hypothetical protein